MKNVIFSSANKGLHTPPCDSQVNLPIFADGEPTANTTVTNPSLSSLPYEGKAGIGSFLFRRVAMLLFVMFLAIPQMWGALTAHTPGIYEASKDDGGYGATIVTYSNKKYEVYGFSYNSSGTKPQILWAGTSTNSADGSSVLCSTLSATSQEIAGWISMSTAGKSSTYSMPSSTEFSASTVGSSGLYQMKMQGHKFTIKIKGYDQFSFLGNDNNATQSKGKYLKVTINDVDVTTGISTSTTVRRYDLEASKEYTITIEGLNTSNEHIDAFSLRLPDAKTFDYSFSSEHGTVPDGGNSSEVTLVSLSADGWDFLGWQANQDVKVGTETKTKGTTLAADTKVSLTAATTFTAQWKTAATKSAIVYANTKEASTAHLPTQYSEGTGIASFEPLEDVTGFHFTGWSPSSIGTDATGEQTITAEWVSTYTVKYMDGTTEMGTEKVEVGSHPTASEITTTKEFYSFLGWQRNGVDVNLLDINGTEGEEVTLMAKYNASYASTLDFMAESQGSKRAIATFLGTGNMTGSGFTGNSAYEYSSEKPGFRGFKIKDSGAEIKFLVKANSCVSLFFGSIGSKVTLKIGSSSSEIGTSSGDNARTAYTPFTVTEDMVISLKTQGSSTVTIEKILISQLHTVSFAAGEGGQGEMTPVDVAAGSEYTAPACGFTAEKKQFDKWSVTGVEGVTEVAANGKFNMPANDVTLTAQWKDLYSVSYELDGGEGTVPAEQDHIQGDKFNVAEKGDIVKSGFDFMYWNDGDANFNELDEYEMPNHDVTFTAVWAESTTKYTVTYYDGANVMGTEEVRENEAPKAISIDTDKQGFVFQNWCSDPELQNDVVLEELQIKEATPLYAKYTRAYAVTVDFVEAAKADTKPVISTFLSDNNYTISSLDNVSWDYNTSGKPSDCGLKIEDEVRELSFWVEANKRVKIKVGTLDGKDGGSAFVSQDGGATFEEIVGANPQSSGDPQEYIYNTSDEAQFVFKTKANDGQYVTWNLVQSITIVDKPEFNDDASLKSLTINGVTIEGFAKNKTTYNVALPYNTTEAVVAAVANDEKATVGDISQAESLPGTASFTVTAEDGTTTADYTINFTVAPKDGVSIIKAVASGTTTIGTVTGALAGSAKINTSGSYKMDTKKYFMVALADNQKFQAGDIVEINVCSVNDGNGFTLYTKMNGDDFSSSDLIIDTHENSTSKSKVNLGINRIVLPESYAGSNTIYVGRAGSGDKYLNAGVNQVEVFRPMNPMLTKATILDKEATIDEAAKTVTVEVPYSTDITAVTPAFEFISNDNSKVVITPTEAQDFTEEAKTYRLTDKDGDYTEYVVSITKAAASSDATLNALSVDGYSLAPEFAAETTEYTVERAYADRDADLPTINYTLNHPAASAVKSAEGKVVTITVTAEDGTQKAYTITFTNKAASTDATLSSLKYGETDITLVDEQFEYDVTLPYGTTVVPALSAVKNDPLANDPVIANAPEFVDYEATSTVTVTAESGDEQVYTVNFSVEKFPTIAIFDGSTMTNLATSPDATTGLSWAVVGSTMTASDQSGKKIVYQGISYPRALQAGNSSATKHFTITVPENYQAQIRLLIMTNSSSSTRSAWITTSADKGTKEDAIMSVTSTSYSDLGDGTTDWLEEGTYYVHTDNTINFFVISAKMKEIAPKPVINGISDGTYCEGGDMPTLTVSATVSKGTMHYQWYKGSDAVGTDDASYTPSEDGTYYVVITNKVDGLDDATAQSENVVVESVAGTYITSTTGARDKAGEQVTISVTATGKNLIYAWYACDEIGTISGGKLGEAATLEVTVGENDTYYIVKVNGDCGTEQSEIVKVETWRETTQTLVTESAVWNLNTTDMAEAQVKPTKNVETLLANLYGIKNNDTFHADALLFSGEYLYRDGQTPARPSCGNYFKFTTTVPGMVTVTFSDNGTNGRHIDINGQDSEASSNISDVKTFSAIVEAGEVMIKGENAGASDMAYVRFYKITFTAATKIRSGLTNGKLVTMCQAQPIAKMWGGAAFDVEKKYSVGIELIEAELPLVAGKPYIVLAEAPEIYVLYAEGDAAEAPVSVEEANGLVGNLNTATTNLMLPDGEDTYIFSNNHLCSASGSNGNFAAPDRAYLNYGKVTDQTVVNAAPSRRRISMGGASTDTPTALDAIISGKDIRKMIINHQLIIIRDGHFFNAQGARMR